MNYNKKVSITTDDNMFCIFYELGRVEETDSDGNESSRGGEECGAVNAKRMTVLKVLCIEQLYRLVEKTPQVG